MTTVSSSLPRHNPLLRDVENVSPALELSLVVEYDAEGWEVRECFRVGAVVSSLNGRLYRIIGFSYDDTVFVSPHGLGHEAGVSSVEFKAAGLRNLTGEAVELLRHKHGLVSFG